jgi:hypothetical protein
MTVMADLMDVMTESEASDPAVGLRSVVVLRRLADEIEIAQVDNARRAGWSWQEIGDALGISRQAAHKKHKGRSYV